MKFLHPQITMNYLLLGIIATYFLRHLGCEAFKVLSVRGISQGNGAPTDSTLPSRSLINQGMSPGGSVTTQCKRHWHLLLNQSNAFKRQVETTAAYLRHPISVVGSTWPESFRNCLDLQIDSPTEGLPTVGFGQYCIAYFLHPTTDRYTYEERLLGTNKFPILSQAETIPNLGICVPSTCTSLDVKLVFEQLVSEVQWNVSVKVPSNYCQTRQTQPEPTALTFYVLLILVTVCLLVSVGTGVDWWLDWRFQSTHITLPLTNGHITDNGKPLTSNGVYYTNNGVQTANCKLSQTNDIYYTNGKKKCPESTTLVKVLRCFSIYTNGHSLFSTEVPEGSVQILHGLRFISLLGMIIAHTMCTSLPFTHKNNGDIKHANQYLIQFIQNTGLFNDTFFFISGFLAAFVHLKKMKANGGHLGILSFYWYRWMRLTPPYAFYIVFTMGVLVLFSGSPRWPHFVEEVENCKQNWWLNMLYINNFFGLDAMCQLHFWYLATVMQLHLITPIFLYALYRYPKLGISLAFCCLAASNISHGTITYFHDLPPAPFVLNNVPGEKLHQYLADVHFPVYIKLGSYAIGMVVGRHILLHGKSLKMKPITAFLLWPLMLVLGFGISVFALGRYYYPGEIVPTISESALYAGTSRGLWDLIITFLIVTNHTGRGGIITKFLSWRFFTPLSRLTYCAYIIHYNVLVIYFSSRPAPMDFTSWNAYSYFVMTVVTSFLLAIPLSLGFELPAMQLAKLFEKKRSS